MAHLPWKTTLAAAGLAREAGHDVEVGYNLDEDNPVRVSCLTSGIPSW